MDQELISQLPGVNLDCILEALLSVGEYFSCSHVFNKPCGGQHIPHSYEGELKSSLKFVFKF